MNQPWKTDRWFVSPWNYVEEVTRDLRFAEEILIHDMTLRDGEQQAGIALRKDDKIRIAEKLAEAGVHRIEAGMPAVSKDDEEAIKEIVKRNLGPQIFAFSRCVVEDVKRAADCGVDGIVIEIPASQHIIQYAYQWPVQKAIDLSIKATRVAKEEGLYTAFFTIDASRAELKWLLDLLEKVATEGHMDALVLVDTMGVCLPGAIRYFVNKVRERFDKPLEAHFHDDLGLATVNTLEALSQGVQVAHTTVCGIGERAGGAALEDVVIALLTCYGLDIGVKTEKLFELSQLVIELTGHRLPANKSVVGEQIFDLESGIPATWSRRCAGPLITEVFPFHWDLMGHNPPKIVLGKGSGTESIVAWLEEIGVEASAEEVRRLTTLVKEKSMAKRGLLTKAEFEELVRSVV
ncbi:MAG: pyruvate carboxyltransferase [Anaerolineae bacterium]